MRYWREIILVVVRDSQAPWGVGLRKHYWITTIVWHYLIILSQQEFCHSSCYYWEATIVLFWDYPTWWVGVRRGSCYSYWVAQVQSDYQAHQGERLRDYCFVDEDRWHVYFRIPRQTNCMLCWSRASRSFVSIYFRWWRCREQLMLRSLLFPYRWRSHSLPKDTRVSPHLHCRCLKILLFLLLVQWFLGYL